jgi:predicted ATPase
MEDLHWVDPTTLELLSLLVDQGPTARILAVFTFRPDFSPPWTGRSHFTQVTLTRLPPRHAAEMTHGVAHGKALPPEVVEQVVAQTDGVPLFVEELTKMVLESGLLQERPERYELAGPLPPLAIPNTLHDSLMARLDRLATVKGLAQLGATLGREFSYDLLQAVSPWDEATLQRGLQQLVAAEFLYQQGLPPQATYRFKHALIQDAAYQSLLRSTRQQYHQRTAQALEAHFPETAETQPEWLAHHYTQAGLSAQAIPYWQRAGQRALQRSAYVEAIGHLSKGLEVLTTLPDTSERSQQELVLQTVLGPALMNIKGQAAPEVEQTYARARELCRQIGDAPQLFPVLWGLWYFYLVRAELQTAREVLPQLLSLAQRGQDSALLLAAHRSLGQNLTFLGELLPARTHLEQGMALYDPLQHRALALRYGQDLKVVCQSWAALVLWLLGYPDQALQHGHAAIALAQELAHSYSLIYALNWVTMLHLCRRERQAAQERAEGVLAIGREYGIAMFAASGTLWQGWGRATQAHLSSRAGEEGMAQMRQGLAAWRATGAAVFRPYGLALLATVSAKAGQHEAGLILLAEALAVTNDKGERRWEAELYRLKGEVLLAHAAEHHVEVETCFHQALDVARQQQAKSWELRAATSLSRLWQQQGKRAEAHELLAPVYNWFTEGFDTADLREAKALLEELS